MKLSNPIPPLSVVRFTKASASEPALRHYEGQSFRIGYYGRQDGLDCVWLVNDEGEYQETFDQEMITTHLEVLFRSEETDFFGDNRAPLGPLKPSS